MKSHGAPRPKYLDLIHIHLPIPGIVSILHRIGGAALFVFLPLLLYLLQRSLGTPEEFGVLSDGISNLIFKVVLIGLLWAFLHHLCAGVRHLASDLDLGTEIKSARFASWLVLAVSIGLTIVIGVRIW